MLTIVRNERDAEKPSAAGYRASYAEARRKAAQLSVDSRRKLAEVYLEAADEAARVVRDSLERGLSQLTTERWAALERKLRAAADGLAQGTETVGHALVGQAAPLFPEVDADFLFRAGQFAGAKDITRKGLERMVSGIESRVVASLTSRLWGDGHTFSERVWATGSDGRGRPLSARGDWLERIRWTVAAGIAQGRDPAKIAKDIQVYTADGLVALSQRWGTLERGTSAFSKRLPRRLDWRAQRLVRSELYASLQDASALAGQANPGSDGLYDWVLSVGHGLWACECEDLAAGGPYTYEALPTYPHPNCHPAGTLILTTRGEVPIEEVIPGDQVLSHDGTVQRVLNSWRNSYEGQMLRVVTSEGEIEATPEHPLLAAGSWRSANALQEGDDLARVSVNIESLAAVEAEANNAPSARLEERGLYRILSLLPRGGMPIPAIDFNGELFILKSKINSISAYDEVRDRLFSSSPEGLIHHAFVGRPEVSGIELRAAGLLFIRYGPTPDGIMCGAGVSLLPTGIASAMAFGDGRQREPEGDEIAVDAEAGNAEALRYLVDREALVPEELREFGPVKIDSSTHNSIIVSAVSKYYKGIVYNLSVENTHSYIANGFASHNCMCWIRPHLRPMGEFLGDLKKWAKGESVDYLDDWYKGTYQAAA